MESSTVYVLQESSSPDLLDALQQLQVDTRVTAHASDLLEALRAEADQACVVIDLESNSKFGLELQSQALTERIPIPFLFLVERADTQFYVTAMRRGAITVLEKPISQEKLKAAIDEALLSANAFRALADSGEYCVRLASLTQRERRIVHLAADGMPNKRIAAVLGLSVKTVEKQRRQAYQRLHVASTAEMTRAVTLGSLHTVLHNPNRIAAEYWCNFGNFSCELICHPYAFVERLIAGRPRPWRD